MVERNTIRFFLLTATWVMMFSLGACSKTTVDRSNRPCDADGNCITGYVCNPVSNLCEQKSNSCIDADSDGFGVGAACNGPDCDDTAPTCTDNCGPDVDNDGVSDCADDCIDVDGDGYGVAGATGNGCAGEDCSDILATCTTDCVSDLDADSVIDCLDNCIDVDGDGYGVDGGGGVCLGPDCDDSSRDCYQDCTDVDQDGTLDCLDTCIDQDGDGYGRAGILPGTCLGDDCDDTVDTCAGDCTTDDDDDGIMDCADTCIDADGDNYGLAGGAGDDCLGADCHDGFATCALDCETDVDGDDTPDCADTCLDADGDGYGEPGPFGNTCIADDCDDNYASCTTDCSGTCTCTGSDSLVLTTQSICASPLAGTPEVVLMQLMATTTCINAITALTIERHALSTTPDNDLENLSLYVDVDATGSVTVGDELLSGPAAMSAAVNFAGFNKQVIAGQPLRLLVVADIAAGAGHSLLALQVASPDAIVLADTNESRILEATPLVAGVIAIDANVCDNAPASEQVLDEGPGWIPPVGLPNGSVRSYEHTVGTPWYEQPNGDLQADGTATADCRLDTSDEGGTNTGQLTDEGTNGSRYLHVDTGIPLAAGSGLPLCALRLRVHASMERIGRNDCRDPPGYQTFEGFASGANAGGEIYLYTYATASTIEPATQTMVSPIVWFDAPDAGTATCNTDYVVLDLLPMYQAAVSNPSVTTETFALRMIVEWGDGLTENPNRRISQVPEVYFAVEP